VIPTQLLDLTSGPVMASHSNCRAIVPTDRQLSDDMIRALGRRGGVVGINFFDTFLLPPGETEQLELALVGDAFSDHFRRVPETIRDLARVKDAGDGWHDPLPTLYSAFSLAHFAGVSHSEHAQLQDAMDADMTWDGEPISGMSEADAELLAEVTGGG
jgi:microsomal dipeptidase-like Zn-dependent dipeptidase